METGSGEATLVLSGCDSPRLVHSDNLATVRGARTLNFGKEHIRILLIINGGRGGNRTHNPRLRRPVLYPIELLAHASSHFSVESPWNASPTAARHLKRLSRLLAGWGVVSFVRIGGRGQQKPHHCRFRPVNLIAQHLERDRRSGRRNGSLQKLRAGWQAASPRVSGSQADEGVVLGMQDQGGHRNPVYHARAGSSVIVVVGVAKAPVAGNNLVVELADGSYRPDGLPGSVDPGKSFALRE